MRRREFVGLVGSAATAFHLIALRRQAHAQTQMRRIGILGLATRNAANEAYFEALTNSLEKQGWIVGQNIIIDWRWAENSEGRLDSLADEILNLKPDVIVAPTTRVVATFKRKTKKIPIVFVAVADPVGSELVASLAQPGANITGFANFEPSLFRKAIETLKEISSGMNSVCWMYNPEGIGHAVGRPDLEAAARHYGIEFIDSPVRSASEIEGVIANQGAKAASGMIVSGEPFTLANLNLIVSLMAQYRLPAMYFFRVFPDNGGLISYGNDLVEGYGRAASYVDRILRGERPENLPVQLPTRFELVINLKAAEAIGVTIPPTLLARADHVVE